MAQVLFHIEMTPELYNQMAGKTGKEIKHLAYLYAEDNANEFGAVFQVEMDVLSHNDWAEIARKLQ